MIPLPIVVLAVVVVVVVVVLVDAGSSGSVVERSMPSVGEVSIGSDGSVSPVRMALVCWPSAPGAHAASESVVS